MRRKQPKLVWDVIHQSVNRGVIEKWNVFDHGGVMENITKAFKKHKNNKEEFLKAVKSSLMYYYWSKCEWEVVLSNQDGKMIITPWVGRRDEHIFLDVSDDKDFDWLGFYNKMTEHYVVEHNSVKIDVYDQVMFMWNEFSVYLLESLTGG